MRNINYIIDTFKYIVLPSWHHNHQCIIIAVIMVAMLLVLYLGMAVYQSYKLFAAQSAAHKMSTYKALQWVD